MIEQDNNGMKTSWTELELGNSCYSSYIVEPIFVPKETAFWLCRPDGTREASRLTFAVFSQRGTDEWEDDPMLGPIDVTLLDDDNIRPFPTLYLGVAPEDFIHLEEEDEESVTFSFHWIEGDITSAQGEETGGGLRFRKSLFEGGKTVSLKLTPYDGTPFVLHLRIPVKGFQLLDAEDRPQQGELVVDPATAKEYQYQFVGTPNDDRFTIAINGGLHILLCIWQEDDTLTLRDHKNGLAVVGTIPAKGSLTELMMQGDEALVKYKEHRWHIAVKSQLTAEEDLPECTPSALVAHAFHAYRQTEDNGRERLEHELLGMEERLCFQWFWMDEKEWDFDHIGPLLEVDKVADDPQEMMRLALVYDNFCAFMRRLSALSYKNGGRIEVDQLQARNNKRKIARCVRHIAKHRSGEINIWELEESAREEIVKLFRIFRNEFVKELEVEG